MKNHKPDCGMTTLGVCKCFPKQQSIEMTKSQEDEFYQNYSIWELRGEKYKFFAFRDEKAKGESRKEAIPRCDCGGAIETRQMENGRASDEWYCLDCGKDFETNPFRKGWGGRFDGEFGKDQYGGRMAFTQENVKAFIASEREKEYDRGYKEGMEGGMLMGRKEVLDEVNKQKPCLHPDPCKCNA